MGLFGRITEAKALRVAKRTDPNAFTALVVLEVLLCAGLRVGELVGIRVPDIDLLERVITIMGKGSRQRRVFLPDDETAVIAHGGGAAGVQATANVPSTRARMAFQADWPCKRAVPVTDR